jgi:hypothetical protein
MDQHGLAPKEVKQDLLSARNPNNKNSLLFINIQIDATGTH